MGNGTWSAKTYKQRAQKRQQSGKDAFAYSQQAHQSGRWEVHPTLDPYGLTFRESRDNDEHPASNSIMIALDVSGSMDRVVRGIHGDLPQLLELLLDRGYVPHPQIMFSAFSNGTCDRVPLQVGQFESDNRMDENLENMFLGGGCDNRESAELALYVAARHTAIDCWEKRQRKGYLFIITDEMAYDNVKRDEVNAILNAGLEDNIPLKQIVAEAQQRYHVFVIIPVGASGGRDPKVYEHYKDLVGRQYVIQLEAPEDVSEVIALTIGLTEGTIGMDDGIEHLRAIGSNKKTVDMVSQALSSLGK